MHEDDVRGNALAGKRVAVIGFGSQGHAHAQNMADSGCDVVVGLREGSASRAAAEEAGLRVTSVGEAVAQGDVVMVLIPDELQADVYEREIKPNLKPGAYLAFAHGFAIHFKRIVPSEDVNVFLVAPKGPGHLVRWQYEAGAGVPCLIAVHQNPAGDTRDVALSYACAIGGGRAGILETSFREETETDLFGEQAVLCGGLTELIRAGFETLVEAGYAPEMAYFECLHEVKLITDLIHERGITGMRDSISNTAEYGDITRGRKVIGAEARQAMKTILADIQSGSFAAEWVAECDAGKPRMTELAAKDAQHPVEQIGREIRGMMPWLQAKRGKAAGAAPRPSGEQATTSAAPKAEPTPATPSSGGSSRLPRPAGARTSSAQSPRAHAGPAADPSHGWPGFEDPPCWYLRPRSTDGRG